MIENITHPSYSTMLTKWKKYRDILESGHDFVESYLKKFSVKETALDFTERKAISYPFAHSKAAVMKIRNAIVQRLGDVVRSGGAQSFQQAAQGLIGGVDKQGATITSFVASKILPELLFLGKVGVFVDKLPQDEAKTKADVAGNTPYIYIYKAEDIRSWSHVGNVLTSVLVRNTDYVIDEETGLAKDTVQVFFHYTLNQGTVVVKKHDENGELLGSMTLNIPRIPLVIGMIDESLLTDIADHQIAGTNLASSDINYAFKSNYPFYTEQQHPGSDQLNVRRPVTGEATVAGVSKDNDLQTGAIHGRAYAAGLDRPQYIHPSPEPLFASMKKQETLKDEIHELLNLTIERLDTSVDSKNKLESGLSAIGSELQRIETAIMGFWNAYEGSSDASIVLYPKNFTLRTDEERRLEAKDLRELRDTVNSTSFKKEISKEIARITLGHKVTQDTLMKIEKEIDTADVVVTDPEILVADHEAGFVGTELASQLRGYPKGEVEKAKQDHAERAQRIAQAQSSILRNPEGRGVDDLSADNGGADEEKTVTQDPDISDKAEKKVKK
jgi:hypothetical protein